MTNYDGGVVLDLEIENEDGIQVENISVNQVVIAGWTGRDSVAMQEHVRELSELGIPAPSSMPLFYRISPTRLTNGEKIFVCGTQTGGEAEVVAIKHNNDLYIGVGSDHTDRALETHSVALSKQICDKPIGRKIWKYQDLAPYWDDLYITSYTRDDGKVRTYQRGVISELLSPIELITRYAGKGKTLANGTVMFCGTLPAIGGVRPTQTLEVILENPVSGRSIHHLYRAEQLPIIK